MVFYQTSCGSLSFEIIRSFVMKRIFFFPITLLLGGVVIFISCKKEKSCEGCRENNESPIAMAGPDQVITLPTDSILLDGTASSDPDGTISEWLWTKISGPASFNIISATAAKTITKNLAAGSYKFELKVTDNGGMSAKDTIQITVNSATVTNHPPIANAGSDTTIILPANTINLDGSSSTDPDNNIVNYSWTKISGPSSSNIANANEVQTQVTNLTEGTYLFELKVTDAGGLFSKDTMQVTVNPQPIILPACDMSTRQTVNAQLLPVGTISEARAGMAVASAGNKILFAGSGGVNSRVDIFDFVANTWSVAALSEARAWIGATAAGNKIFFAGGQYIDGYSSNAVDIYDVSTNSWTVSHLSRGFNGADGLAAASSGNKVFFAGGNWGIYAVKTVDIYDLATNTWSTASLSTPRNFITAVSTNNRVYFTGGDPWTGQMSNVIDIYENATGTWSTSVMQVPRAYHSAAAVNDILYFAGGSDARNSTNCSVETLNTITGARTLMNLFGPASWSIDDGQNAVVKNNKIIFLRHKGGADANKFDIYDIQTNTWSIGVLHQPIPTGASVISVNNTIYVAGGSVNGVLINHVWKLEF
jgi:hypothetical protein